MEQIIQGQMKVSLYWGFLCHYHYWLQANKLKWYIIFREDY